MHITVNVDTVPIQFCPQPCVYCAYKHMYMHIQCRLPCANHKPILSWCYPCVCWCTKHMYIHMNVYGLFVGTNAQCTHTFITSMHLSSTCICATYPTIPVKVMPMPYSTCTVSCCSSCCIFLWCACPPKDVIASPTTTITIPAHWSHCVHDDEQDHESEPP